MQLEGRLAGSPLHELLPVEPGRGLARLPAPSAGDLFLDLEDDAFACDGGREYLFGLVQAAAGRSARWAFTDAEEREAFEAVVDEIMRSWAADPGMHVYHYAPYEPAALKRLMGRHASREREIDRMLRAGLFVDLYAVVKQALRASVESYSIKDLEPLYGFSRSVALPDARTHLRDRRARARARRRAARSPARRRGRRRGLQPRRLPLGAPAARLAGEPARGPRGARDRGAASRAGRGGGAGEGRTSASAGPRSSRRRSPRACRPTAARAPTSSRRAGCSRSSSTGTGARTRPAGGSTSGSAICPKTSCSTRRRPSRGCASSRAWAAQREAPSTATPTRRRTATCAKATSCTCRTARTSGA